MNQIHILLFYLSGLSDLTDLEGNRSNIKQIEAFEGWWLDEFCQKFYPEISWNRLILVNDMYREEL